MRPSGRKIGRVAMVIGRKRAFASATARKITNALAPAAYSSAKATCPGKAHIRTVVVTDNRKEKPLSFARAPKPNIEEKMAKPAQPSAALAPTAYGLFSFGRSLLPSPLPESANTFASTEVWRVGKKWVSTDRTGWSR